MRICPNDKFIEIFAQRFHYFEDPFYKFFALNLLFQVTSYSLALKYSSFLFRFFSFAFYNINFWFKISKVCLKILHFSQISHSRGNTACNCVSNLLGQWTVKSDYEMLPSETYTYTSDSHIAAVVGLIIVFQQKQLMHPFRNRSSP